MIRHHTDDFSKIQKVRLTNIPFWMKMDQQDSILHWISLYYERNQQNKIDQVILKLLSSA
jgi:hypothetical protein